LWHGDAPRAGSKSAGANAICRVCCGRNFVLVSSHAVVFTRDTR
jgi:hypothetical protein